MTTRLAILFAFISAAAERNGSTADAVTYQDRADVNELEKERQAACE